MVLLSIEHFSYTYPGSSRPALLDLSLSIGCGEFVALVGASNSGKSTFCYGLAGVVPHLFQGHVAGRITGDGVDHATRDVADIACDIGLVLQSPPCQMSGIRYTVFEEIAFGLENRGVPREEILHRVKAVLGVLGMQDIAERSPLHLSGGQQQRLALATVMAVDPAILVLDEPTTFLDPQGTHTVFEMLRRLQQQGKTIVITEQRLEFVAEYADRVLVISQGRIVMDGHPREVLASQKMRDACLEWTRYTQAAFIARQRGLWPADLPLPASLVEACDGFSVLRNGHADSR